MVYIIYTGFLCGKILKGIRPQKQRHRDSDNTYYTDFGKFIKHDTDSVVLANCANEHAPFTVKANRMNSDTAGVKSKMRRF